MAELAFDLEYDGPALAAHEMDVRELAPALLSTANLFQSLNRTLRPADPEVTVNVRATTEGSFIVQLKLIYDSSVGVLTSPDVTAGVNLTGLLTVVGGLIAYLRKRHRTAVERVEPSQDPPGMVTVWFVDGTVMQVPPEVLRAADEPSVRRNLNELVRPLEVNPGVETVTIRQDTRVVAEVAKADVAAYAPVDGERRQVLAENERNVFLTIINAAFTPGHKWRFSDGQVKFYAVLRDEGFIARVAAGVEQFTALDVLRCVIRHTQWRDDTGLHSEVEVLRVLEHVPHDPTEQGELFPMQTGPEPLAEPPESGSRPVELGPGD